MGDTPRFLLIKKKEGDFESDSPFLISKTLYGLAGETRNIRKLKSGLLVETVSTAQSLRLLKVQRFADFPVEVTPHNTLNSSKGVIYCKDLLHSTVEEILEELRKDGVTNVRRIKTKKDGVLVDTPTHILTFGVPKLPAHIKVAFYKLPVRPYIPPPLRCFKCQKFGHTATQCTLEQVCVCGQPLHEGNPCRTPLVCINCNGHHSARPKICPKYKEEEAIQKVKTIERISYAEAKRKVVIRTPVTGVSYAQTVQHSQAKNFDPQEILSQLIPVITDIIELTLEKNLHSIGFSQEPHISRAVPSSLVATNNEAREKFQFPQPPASQEKRKRDPASPQIETQASEDTCSENSETSEKRSSAKPPKRKPGRPKGKPPNS